MNLPPTKTRQLKPSNLQFTKFQKKRGEKKKGLHKATSTPNLKHQRSDEAKKSAKVATRAEAAREETAFLGGEESSEGAGVGLVSSAGGDSSPAGAGDGGEGEGEGAGTPCLL